MEETRDRCLRYQVFDGSRNEELPGAATIGASTTAIFNIVVSVARIIGIVVIIVISSGILLGADVIFIVVIVVVNIVVIGFLGSGAILVLTVVAVVLAAIIGTTVVVIVLAVIGLARDLLGRTFVMLVEREFRDAGQLAIPHGIQRLLPAARSTTANCYGLPVLRR